MKKTLFLLLLGYCTVLSAGTAQLSFKWDTEVSDALPYNANAFQGETFTLDVALRQYGQNLTGDAAATFYYQTKDMAADAWYSATAQWDATTGRASVDFTPAMDCGASAYRFFFGIETTQGKNYRAYGTLRMKPSPGFNPAQLEAPDVYAEIIADILQDVFAQTDTRYASQADLDALEAAVATKADTTHNHDGTYLKSYTETDPLWSAAKPTIEANLQSANQQISQSAADIVSLQEAIDNIDPVISWTDVKDKPETFTPSEHTHSQYLTAYTETDPTIAAWAKALTKPTYTYAEITDTPTTWPWTSITGAPTTWDWSALTGVPDTFTPATHNHDTQYLKASNNRVSSEVYFDGGFRADSFKTIYGAPLITTVASKGFAITGIYTLTAYNKSAPFYTYDISNPNNETIDVKILKENGTALANKYAAKTHTHSDLNASIATLQAEAATHAPLSSVTMTESDTTYIWQWDDDAQTFALVTQE